MTTNINLNIDQAKADSPHSETRFTNSDKAVEKQVINPERNVWEKFLNSPAIATEDFLSERENPPQQEREDL